MKPILCAAINLPNGAVPNWVHLLPAGAIRTIDGRGPYRVQDVAALMSTSIAAGKLPLDENHATDLAAPKGGEARARGWIVELQSRADGVWGRVEWTSAGRQIMADRAYRGISPVIAAGKDGSISAILRASLTNTPNLAGLASLHSQARGGDDDANRLNADELVVIDKLGLDPKHYAAARLPSRCAGKMTLDSTSRHQHLSKEDRAVADMLGLDLNTYVANRAEQG